MTNVDETCRNFKKFWGKAEEKFLETKLCLVPKKSSDHRKSYMIAGCWVPNSTCTAPTFLLQNFGNLSSDPDVLSWIIKFFKNQKNLCFRSWQIFWPSEENFQKFLTKKWKKVTFFGPSTFHVFWRVPPTNFKKSKILISNWFFCKKTAF